MSLSLNDSSQDALLERASGHASGEVPGIIVLLVLLQLPAEGALLQLAMEGAGMPCCYHLGQPEIGDLFIFEDTLDGMIFGRWIEIHLGRKVL